MYRSYIHTRSCCCNQNSCKKDKDIICITPAMCYGSKLDIIKEKLPKQELLRIVKNNEKT